MPEITTVTSERLQATIRRLLPSQRGFGTDLEAQNVIVPIVDLTATAEGSDLREDLQTAANLSGNTAFSVVETTTDIVTTPGFYRVLGGVSIRVDGSAFREARLQLSDGSTTKTILGWNVQNGINNEIVVQNFDIVCFLRTGDKIRVETDTGCVIEGSTRQIADVNGNLVNPVGFSFE